MNLGENVLIVPASRISEDLWPEILHSTHKDYIWPFSKIGRWRTAYFGKPPIKLAGNAPEHSFFYKQVGTWVWRRCTEGDPEGQLFLHPKPIPEPGTWWRGTPNFYASKSPKGWYYRRGYRWDDIDGYYQWPAFKIGKYSD